VRELTILLLAVAVFWAIGRWRLVLLLCIATAILQDPLRKLTPHQPVIFVVMVGVVFGAAWIGAWLRGVSLGPNTIFRQYRQLAMPFSLLTLLIIVQAGNSYLRFENPMITGLGILTYVLPLASIIFAYQLIFRQGEFGINQFLKWYVVLISLVLPTVYLASVYQNTTVLHQVGPKLLIFDKTTGVALISYSGIFRSAEIAAWHAMTAACFVTLLAFSRKINLTRFLFAAILVALLISIGILTGRRKLIMELAVFVGTYFIIWMTFQKGSGKLVVIPLIVVAMVVYGSMAAILRDGDPSRPSKDSLAYSHYLERTETVFHDVPTRVIQLGIGPIMWAYDNYGLFGAGLGVGTQGTQYFGGGAEGIGAAGAAEGGLGKIVLELGIPGLFTLGWIGLLLFQQFWWTMRVASRHSPRIARLSFGLFSFLAANVAAFSVATQAFGDLFVLLILSWIVGFLLAIPVLVERDARARRLAVEEVTPVFRPRTA
jgi:hypothetical protein